INRSLLSLFNYNGFTLLFKNLHSLRFNLCCSNQSAKYNNKSKPRTVADVEIADKQPADYSTDTDSKVKCRHIPAEYVRAGTFNIFNKSALYCRGCCPLEKTPDKHIDIEQDRRAVKKRHYCETNKEERHHSHHSFLRTDFID